VYLCPLTEPCVQPHVIGSIRASHLVGIFLRKYEYTPKNKSGRTLKNYAGTAFQQLSIAGIELSLFPVPDAVQKGVDETLMKLYVVGGRRSAGELRRDPLPAEPAQEGDLLYTFASNDEFFMKNRVIRVVSPFEPAPEFVLERIEDEDFVTADNPDDAFPEKILCQMCPLKYVMVEWHWKTVMARRTWVWRFH